MPLLLMRQKASKPYAHDKLNIDIWSEQELCYLIYNYPLLCLNGFVTAGLAEWIRTELRLKPLSDRLLAMIRAGETADSMLTLILQECNYYDVSEVMDFAARMAELKKYSDGDLTYLKGRALFKAGSFSDAYDMFDEAVKKLEREFRSSSRKDDRALRQHNEKKAGIYCDMAAVKMQMFDEKTALKLLSVSSETCANLRAEKMKYLIDGSGELTDEIRSELDAMREDALEAARESKAYRDTEAIFDMDKASAMRAARKTAASWKTGYRRM